MSKLKDKTSKRPWRVGQVAHYILDADGDMVGNAITDADQELIVSAVNAYDPASVSFSAEQFAALLKVHERWEAALDIIQRTEARADMALDCVAAVAQAKRILEFGIEANQSEEG